MVLKSGANVALGGRREELWLTGASIIRVGVGQVGKFRICTGMVNVGLMQTVNSTNLYNGSLLCSSSNVRVANNLDGTACFPEGRNYYIQSIVGLANPTVLRIRFAPATTNARNPPSASATTSTPEFGTCWRPAARQT